MYKPISRFI